jgi:SNF2 family DNA or RNA helicase
MNLLDPFDWTWVNFFNRYCGGEEMGYNGATNLDDLNERLKSIMLRRFKTDVLDQLPAFTRTHVPVSLEPKERNTYDGLASQNPTTIVNLFPGSKGYFANPLDWLNAIRQYLERLRLSRVEDWAEDFLSSGTGKLVIYCGFKSSVARLEESLKEYGVAKITGDVSNSNRQEIIDRWQTTNDKRVMLLTSAGGEGIDLFGKNGIECSTLVFAGREWSPMVEEQIEGRLDRMGQTFPVEAVYLTIQGTVDEDIDALIEEKRTIIRDALGLEAVDTNIVGDLFEILRKRGIIFKEHKEKKHGEG